MTAQMNHTHHRTSTVERPSTTGPGGTTGTTPTQPSGRGGGRRTIIIAAIASFGVLAAWTGALVLDANNEPSSSPVEYTTSQRLVEESIDQSLAERQAPVEYTTSQRLVEESIDQSLAERQAPVEMPGTNSPVQVPAPNIVAGADGVPEGYDVDYWQSVEDYYSTAEVVQAPTGELPAHLQDFETRFNETEFTTSQRLIEESIDEALAATTTADVTPEAGGTVRSGLPDGYWQPSSNTNVTSDGSFDVAEANRMATLQDVSVTNGSDGSFDVAEANRMATLQDVSVTNGSDGSFDVAEANRMATLQDLSVPYTPVCKVTGPC
jgi:hypothetical protein